jgi:hypothetical protein
MGVQGHEALLKGTPTREVEVGLVERKRLGGRRSG